MRLSTLKLAMLESGRRQIEISLSTGISQGRLSNIANRWVRPTIREQTLLSRELDRPVEKLFPEVGNEKENLMNILNQ